MSKHRHGIDCDSTVLTCPTMLEDAVAKLRAALDRGLCRCKKPSPLGWTWFGEPVIVHVLGPPDPDDDVLRLIVVCNGCGGKTRSRASSQSRSADAGRIVPSDPWSTWTETAESGA